MIPTREAKFTQVEMPGTNRKFLLKPKIAKMMKTATNPMKAPAAGLRKRSLKEKLCEAECVVVSSVASVI